LVISISPSSLTIDGTTAASSFQEPLNLFLTIWGGNSLGDREVSTGTICIIIPGDYLVDSVVAQGIYVTYPFSVAASSDLSNSIISSIDVELQRPNAMSPTGGAPYESGTFSIDIQIFKVPLTDLSHRHNL
jgi:hypothetical protein